MSWKITAFDHGGYGDDHSSTVLLTMKNRQAFLHVFSYYMVNKTLINLYDDKTLHGVRNVHDFGSLLL